MLIIQNGSQVEPLLESNYEKTEELNGTLQISFDSFNFAENIGHELIDFEVTVEDEDGHVYIVKQISGDEFHKQVVAQHEYFDLADEYQYETFAGTHTFDEFIAFTLKNTDWSFINEGISEPMLIPNFGNANPLVLIDQLLETFKIERQILPNKVIRFAKVIGEDNDLQFRYRHNIETLSYQVDTNNLKTQIRGFGANGLSVTYTSPLASNPRIGIKIAEPIYNDSYDNANDLEEYLKQQLSDTPKTSIEVNVTTVDGEVGDYIWLIHEPLNYEYLTRILSKKTMRNYKDSSVTVGNAVKNEIMDILVNQKIEINQNNKLTRSKFEQTNDRITAEVETIGESIASLEIRADEIELSVSNVEGNVSSLQIQANQIQSTVSSQSSQISSMQSQITQQANEISLKVSEEDYNGNKIASLINQTATTIEIQASKINLTGAVTVLSDITDDLGYIYAGTLNLTSDAQIGRNLTMYGFNGGRIELPATGCQIIADSSGDVTIEAYNDLELVASDIYLYGDVHFQGDVDGVALSDTNGLGFGYSSTSKRLYVRINGSNVGYVNLT